MSYQYRGLKGEYEKHVVTDMEVDHRLKMLATQNPRIVPINDRASQEGDELVLASLSEVTSSTSATSEAAGNAQLPVLFSLEGPGALVGPKVVTAEGGMCGTLLRTTGETGTARLTVVTSQTESVTVEFRIG